MYLVILNLTKLVKKIVLIYFGGLYVLDIVIILNFKNTQTISVCVKFFIHIVIHFGPGENHSEDAVMMNTPVVKAALEMGFSRRLVKQTVQSKILTTGENYKTISDLVLDLLNAEDEIREEEKERATEEKESGT